MLSYETQTSPTGRNRALRNTQVGVSQGLHRLEQPSVELFRSTKKGVQGERNQRTPVARTAPIPPREALLFSHQSAPSETNAEHEPSLQTAQQHAGSEPTHQDQQQTDAPRLSEGPTTVRGTTHLTICSRRRSMCVSSPL